MKINFMIPEGMEQTTKYLTDELSNLSCDVDTNIIYNSLSPLYYSRLAKKMSNCDVMHIQSTYWCFGRHGEFLSFFYRNVAPKVVTTLHEPIGHFHKGFIRYITERYYKWLAKQTIKYSDKVLVSTEGKRQLDRMGLKSDKVLIAHRGSYQNPKIINKEECKEKLGLSGKKVILLFGRIRYGKGYDTILDILPNLDNDVVVLIAGSPRIESHMSYYKSLKEKADDRVIFHGFVEDEDIPVIFNASDIAVLPYRHSTQSDVIRMVLAFGLPCITSNLGFFNDILNKYDCIQMYEDKNDLVKRINELIDNEEEKNRLKINSKKFWVERNWCNIAKERIKLYNEIVGGKNEKDNI